MAGIPLRSGARDPRMSQGQEITIQRQLPLLLAKIEDAQAACIICMEQVLWQRQAC